MKSLRDGHIFAAGLDVTDPEPLAADDPLLELPNCVITPHIASATVETRDAMASIAAANLLAGLSGRPLPHEVRDLGFSALDPPGCNRTRHAAGSEHRWIEHS